MNWEAPRELASALVQTQADVQALRGVERVLGTLTIAGDQIQSLAPLESISYLGGLSINGCAQLQTLDGLDALENIAESGILAIEDTALSSIEALGALRGSFTAHEVRFVDNPALREVGNLAWAGELAPLTVARSRLDVLELSSVPLADVRVISAVVSMVRLSPGASVRVELSEVPLLPDFQPGPALPGSEGVRLELRELVITGTPPTLSEVVLPAALDRVANTVEFNDTNARAISLGSGLRSVGIIILEGNLFLEDFSAPALEGLTALHVVNNPRLSECVIEQMATELNVHPNDVTVAGNLPCIRP